MAPRSSRLRAHGSRQSDRVRIDRPHRVNGIRGRGSTGERARRQTATGSMGNASRRMGATLAALGTKWSALPRYSSTWVHDTVSRVLSRRPTKSRYTPSVVTEATTLRRGFPLAFSGMIFLLRRSACSVAGSCADADAGEDGTDADTSDGQQVSSAKPAVNGVQLPSRGSRDARRSFSLVPPGTGELRDSCAGSDRGSDS